MKVVVQDEVKAKKARTYPYLSRKVTGELVLVGRYSAIILSPKADGDGYRGFNGNGPISPDQFPEWEGGRVILSND